MMGETCDEGGWIQVHSGARFYPLAPNAEVLSINDVAIPLSRACRYGGHCLRFYSVAEHSVLMARYMGAKGRHAHVCLQALMHDASEAFIADIVRPVKGKILGYKDAENVLMHALGQRFDFIWPMLPTVQKLDAAMIAVERANMAPMDVPDHEWGITEPAAEDMHLAFWRPEQAAAEFLTAFTIYGGIP